MTRYTKGKLALAALCALPMSAVVTYADSLPSAGAPTADASDPHVYTYHQNNILGTSLDLKLVAASQSDADACEQTILGEIERLRLILSTYDKDSEISKFIANPSTDPITVSPELHTVLFDYNNWRMASGGAYTAQLGELLDLWDAAEKKGQQPTDAELAPLLARVHQNALTSISATSVHKLSNQKLNIDSLGKGYIVQKAAALARTRHPLITGILLNIGGDITTLGFATPPSVRPPAMWKVSIADPQNHADNAPPLMSLKVKDKAVATSGTYERFYTFDDKKLSHILNPLTGKPSSNDVLSATVVASDNATANALATILCVLPPADGMKLVEKTTGAAALIVMSDGKQIASRGFAAYQDGGAVVASGGASSGGGVDPAGDSKPASASAWPKNYVLSIDFTQLSYAPNPSYIPYTTMWVEDADGKCVKILAAWIGNKKYLQVMRTFSKACASAPDFASMSRATRRPGEYTIVWDGTDASGNPVAKGTYTLCLEVACEHAGHATARQAVDCGTTTQSGTFPAAIFWDPIPVKYGPAKPSGS